ncbi:hypothetical protein [Spongiimicrobium salis]|uniref:hypothetical protein n=1 Tax=Spongiimicrobium salis TaxID=1667022 RepID=UPI00374CB04B
MKEITTSAILGTLSLLSCIAAVHIFEEEERVSIPMKVSPAKAIIEKKLEDNAMQTLTKDYPVSTMKDDELRCF